jgi:L-ascorbate metabolism protein UlaG (beta-lactamase superfamily)
MVSSDLRKYSIAIAHMFLLVSAASAQEASPLITPTLGPGDDAFITRQSEVFLAEISLSLANCPPAVPEPRERTLALRLLDAVLHDTHSPNRIPVQRFFHERMERAISEIETQIPNEGMQIWKLYNHGFVVRTKSVTVGFDLHRGAARFRWDGPEGRKTVPCPDFPIADALAQRLVKQCDVLFISHEHRDHADAGIAGMFLDQGKPVVAPESALRDELFHGKITHMKREAHTVKELPIRNGATSLKVVVYPGHQYQDGGPENNVPLVISPEGFTFAHNGDQINDPYPKYQEDYVNWIDSVHKHHRVDVFITNCWTNDVLRMAKGLNPELVLTGHENELGHQMNDRVPYWGDEKFLVLNFSEMKRAYPTLVMTWGETYHFVPKRR